MAGMLNRVAGVSIGVGLFGAALNESLYNVEPGFRAVIFNRFSGIEKDVAGEGTHLKVPFIQFPKFMDIRFIPRVISSTTGTKDLQMVNISLRLLCRPDTDHLTTIYKTIGADFGDRVLPSIGNEILKTVVAQYNAEQLLTERDKVSGDIRQELIDRAAEFNLILEDVAITHLTYGKEFTAAIESKQVAQQESERAKFIVLKAEQEKKAKVILAEGEADAAKLISDSLKDSGRGLIEVRRIDAAKDIAETLARSRNITYLPSGDNGSGGPQMLLNIGGSSTQ